MKESQVQKKILDYLKKNGISCFKTVATNRNGVSDIIGLTKQGRFFAIEVKTPAKKNNTSKLQDIYLAEVKASGGIVGVATSVEEVKEILNVQD